MVTTKTRGSLTWGCDWLFTTHTATISCVWLIACIKAERIHAFGTVLCICIKAGHVWIMHSWAFIWVGKNSPDLLWGFWYLQLFRDFVLSWHIFMHVCACGHAIACLFHHENYSEIATNWLSLSLSPSLLFHLFAKTLPSFFAIAVSALFQLLLLMLRQTHNKVNDNHINTYTFAHTHSNICTVRQKKVGSETAVFSFSLHLWWYVSSWGRFI